MQRNIFTRRMASESRWGRPRPGLRGARFRAPKAWRCTRKCGRAVCCSIWRGTRRCQAWQAFGPPHRLTKSWGSSESFRPWKTRLTPCHNGRTGRQVPQCRPWYTCFVCKFDWSIQNHRNYARNDIVSKSMENESYNWTRETWEASMPFTSIALSLHSKETSFKTSLRALKIFLRRTAEVKVTSNIVVSLVLFFRLGISKREWFVYECSWLGALDAINLLAAYNVFMLMTWKLTWTTIQDHPFGHFHCLRIQKNIWLSPKKCCKHLRVNLDKRHDHKQNYFAAPDNVRRTS